MRIEIVTLLSALFLFYSDGNIYLWLSPAAEKGTMGAMTENQQ